MSREGKSTDQSKLLGEKSFTSSPSSYRSRPNFCPSVPLSLVFLFLPFLSLAGRISPPPVPFGVVLQPFALPSPCRPPSPAALSTLEASSRAELEPGFFFFLPSPLPLVLLCPSYAKTFCWFEKVFKCQKNDEKNWPIKLGIFEGMTSTFLPWRFSQLLFHIVCGTFPQVFFLPCLSVPSFLPLPLAVCVAPQLFGGFPSSLDLPNQDGLTFCSNFFLRVSSTKNCLIVTDVMNTS